MKIVWSPQSWDDYVDWQARDPKLVEKINALIADIRRHPFSGIGKPEALKADLAGWWSRRVTSEHRLVCRVIGQRGAERRCEIAQCRFHY